MARKPNTGDADDATGAAGGPDLGEAVRASAQQIWLAGLGAFSKAQEQGGKVFEALVKEGATLQRKTQEVAGDRLNEAGSRMASMASELSSKASGQWDKLESMFEDRVARAQQKLGVPTAGAVQALAARVEELERTVAGLRGGDAPAARRPGRSAARTPAAYKVAPPRAAKAARKRSGTRKTGSE